MRVPAPWPYPYPERPKLATWQLLEWIMIMIVIMIMMMTCSRSPHRAHHSQRLSPDVGSTASTRSSVGASSEEDNLRSLFFSLNYIFHLHSRLPSSALPRRPCSRTWGSPRPPPPSPPCPRQRDGSQSGPGAPHIGQA